jgi:radical SAM protein with 4Fe4S-binding SPASM domain
MQPGMEMDKAHLTSTNVAENRFGRWHIWRQRLGRIFYQRKMLWYLIKKGDFRTAINHCFTRTLVPDGEGAWLAAYPLIRGILRKFPGLAPLPRYVEIEVTTICNKRCIFCENAHWEKNDQVRKHLSFEQFKAIVDQIPIRWTNLTGEGSSFLNPDYMKMVRYLREKYRASIFLVDHLSDMTEEVMEELIDLRLSGIYISFDGGTKETVEKIQVNCEFDTMVANIRRMVEMKKRKKTPFPEMCFRYVVCKENVNEMPIFLDLIKSLGTKEEFGYGHIDFAGLLYFEEIKHLYLEDLPEEIYSELESRKEGSMQFNFSHAVEDLLPPTSCCTKWMESYIMMDGYVLPCCSVVMSNNRPFLHDNAFGNCLETPFKDIWNSERYKKFRRTITNEKAPIPLFCKGCRAYNTRPREEKYGIAEDL